MKDILTYVLGVVVCSGLFAGLYRTVMHRRTSFRVARIYLVASLAVSALIPALDIPVWRVAPIVVSPVVHDLEIPLTGVAPAVVAAPAEWPKIVLWGVWGLGIVLLGVLTVCQTCRISRVRRRAEIHRADGCSVALSDEVEAPFSFLKTVFIGRGISDGDARQIVLHEASHIRHRHSHEKIAAEVLKNLQWFNPFAWWTVRLLSEVHEFEADRDVLDGGFTVEEYLPLIFRQTFGYIPELSVGLGDSLTKKRFSMMTNKIKLSRYSWLRVAGVLPLAAGMMMLFSFTSRSPEIIYTEAPAALEAVVVEAVAPVSAEAPVATPVSPSVAPPAQDAETPLYQAEVMPVFEGGDINTFRNWAMMRLVYPREAVEKSIDGRVVLKFVIEKDGSLTNIETITSPSPLLTAEAVRVLSESPGWTPGMQEGKPVRVFYVMPLYFALQQDPESADNVKTDMESASGISIDIPADKSPLFFLDGRELTAEQLQAIDPATIESMAVLKDASATAMYGPRAKDGVILMATGETSVSMSVPIPEPEPEQIFETGYGQISERDNASAISQLDISDSEGTRYPDLKGYIRGKVSGVQITDDDTVTIRGIGTINSGVDPLVVVDGIQYGSFAQANAAIPPQDVASITVLKDSSATGIYGVRGANGVIVITTKRSNKK